MGSSSSKSAESTPSGHHRRSHSAVFQSSSCIGLPSSGSPDSDDDTDNEEQISVHEAKANVIQAQPSEEKKSNLGRNKKFKVKQPDDVNHGSSNMQLDEWGQSSLSDTVSRVSTSSSQAFSSQSWNTSSRFLSLFNFFPRNLSFRLRRATSLGSLRTYPDFSTSSNISHNEEFHQHSGSSIGMANRYKTPQGCEFFPICLINRSSRPRHEDFGSTNLSLNPSTSSFSDNLQDYQINSTHEGTRDNDNNIYRFNINLHPPINTSASDGFETRVADRQTENREPVERNVRFSRTLSVGRLRDRVLRRSPFPHVLSCPSQEEREVVNASEAHQGSRSQALGGGTGVQGSSENVLISPTSSGYSPSTMSGSFYGSEYTELETMRVGEGRYRDLLERRSNFLEHRRRIRSQVRSLQRMGSRFENLSGHERSCILSGQHRSGHCTCHLSTRGGSSNDGTGARASISRIVLLAEALFEVLDEIHQQSVVLSSRPVLSSIGSVPAPNEVVESLPLKPYYKSLKCVKEEDGQCYICLVDYEDEDIIRVLPCHHEFHRSCIDKWLKEIHRICPLCRGDICRSGSLSAEH